MPSNYFAGYVPDAFGAVGNSGGICMWYGDNCTRFKRDCPNWGVDVTAQFEYLYQTLIKDGQEVTMTNITIGVQDVCQECKLFQTRKTELDRRHGYFTIITNGRQPDQQTEWNLPQQLGII